jgi:hypothetical protein
MSPIPLTTEQTALIETANEAIRRVPRATPLRQPTDRELPPYLLS